MRKRQFHEDFHNTLRAFRASVRAICITEQKMPGGTKGSPYNQHGKYTTNNASANFTGEITLCIKQQISCISVVPVCKWILVRPLAFLFIYRNIKG